jgi:hypothetical protein
MDTNGSQNSPVLRWRLQAARRNLFSLLVPRVLVTARLRCVPERDDAAAQTDQQRDDGAKVDEQVAQRFAVGGDAIERIDPNQQCRDGGDHHD